MHGAYDAQFHKIYSLRIIIADLLTDCKPGGIEWAKEGSQVEIQPIDPEFVRVWSRVKGKASAPEPVPVPAQADGEWGEFLTGKIRAELQRWRDYCSLGLAGPARDSRERAKKLSAAWFFRSGKWYFPLGGGQPNRYSGRLEGIRQLYHGERLSEQDYRKAQDACGGEELGQVFQDCEHSCRSTRQKLWALVERL